MEPTSPRRPRPVRPAGFTLVELLIVIGIITLLISILVPVVSRVRGAAANTAAQSFISQLAKAIDAYEIDFKAYPGPFTNAQVYNQNDPLGSSLEVDPHPDVAPNYMTNLADTKITMAENLVLGLLGGLKYDKTNNKYYYDPREVGNGAFSLNPTAAANKRHRAYTDPVNLSWRMDDSVNPAKKTGQYKDEAGSADDSIIPEFVDTYVDPMPVLYLRAKRGAIAAPGPLTPENNTIVTYDTSNHNNRVGQYDLHQIFAYTSRPIGLGRKSPTHGLTTALPTATSPPADSRTPSLWDAYPYFRNHTLSTPKETDTTNYGTATGRNDVPHQKDGYILISAGADRVYGTRDDITNFGGVGQ